MENHTLETYKQSIKNKKYWLKLSSKNINKDYLLAAKNGKLLIMKYLENNFSNLNIYTKYTKEKEYKGCNALLIATKFGHLDIIYHLIETHNFNIYTTNANKSNVLHLATFHEKENIIEYLIKQFDKKKLYIKNKYGFDPYILALFKGNIKILKILDNKYLYVWKSNSKMLLKKIKHELSVRSSDSEYKQKNKKLKKINSYLKKVKVNDYFRFIGNKKYYFSTYLKVNNSIKPNTSCFICTENFNTYEKLCRCKNNHFIHTDCYNTYLIHKGFTEKKDFKCIYCKQQMLPNSFELRKESQIQTTQN